MLKEFQEFISKGNVIDLAVGHADDLLGGGVRLDDEREPLAQRVLHHCDRARARTRSTPPGDLCLIANGQQGRLFCGLCCVPG